jgi:hypothetical protein
MQFSEAPDRLVLLAGRDALGCRQHRYLSFLCAVGHRRWSGRALVGRIDRDLDDYVGSADTADAIARAGDL